MNPVEKALAINRDGTHYGTFAEIGAGQEVARYFFQAGLASHTVAKTMSAYDMTFSDAIYGREKNGRYVCEPRVIKMLEHEYSLLIDRLKEKRGDNTCFFVFADTIATHSGPEKNNHGWLGIRFQTKPKEVANDFVLHVRLNDPYRLLQQEALGTLGINLIYGALYKYESVPEFITSLTDGLKKGRIEIDMIRSDGPHLSTVNQYQLSLELLRQGLTPAVLFVDNGKPAQPSEVFYKKPVLVQRFDVKDFSDNDFETFNWPKDLLQQFEGIKAAGSNESAKLVEVSLHNVADSYAAFQKIIPALQRLNSKGQSILVSLFPRVMDLKCFLQRHTDQTIGFQLNAKQIGTIFDDKTYSDLQGHLLEGLGKIVGNNNGVLFSAEKLDINALESHQAKALFNYLIEQKRLVKW